MRIILVFTLVMFSNAYSIDVFEKIKELEIKNGLPSGMLKAIIKIESNFESNAVNIEAPVPSYGIGQLTIATAKHHCKLKEEEIMDLKKNLSCSAKVLSHQYKRYKNVNIAVMAYNEGTPCTCHDGFYMRFKKSYCYNWEKVENGWDKSKIKCSGDSVRETDYLRKFLAVYKHFL